MPGKQAEVAGAELASGVSARTDPLDVMRRYGNNPSGFLALNAGTEYFTEPGIDGIIPYRSTKRAWIQFGGPIASQTARPELLQAFLAQAKEKKVRVLGVQLLKADAELQQEYGYSVNQFGTSYSIRLADYTLKGKVFVKTRNMISRAQRDGVEIHEWQGNGVPAESLGQMDEIDGKWLRNKGRFVKPLRFFVGERSGEYNHLRRIFTAQVGERVIAYATYPPVFGEQPGRLYDLTRRRPEEARGAIEQIFATAAERMRDAGDEWLHLGLTPFVDLGPEHDLAGRHKSAARSIKLLADHGGHLYPAASQVSFKKKWRPHQSTPEYITFHGRLGLGDVWQLMKVANLI